jgi:hypothetical protein
MATFGAFTDVETSLLRVLTQSETTYVAAWLDRAERLIRSRVHDLTVRVQSNEDYGLVVAGIEGEMVARVFRNPEGINQEDEGNYSIRLNSAVSSGILTVSDSEWESLGVAINPIKSVVGAMDGYAAARYKDVDPALRFQYGWPATSDSSGGIW